MMIHEGLANRILLWTITLAGLIIISCAAALSAGGFLQSGPAARPATLVRPQPHMVCGVAE